MKKVSNTMIDVAVLIPCYNESKTIEKVILDFKNAVPEAYIFVYDNNSTDGSVEIIERNVCDRVIFRREYMQGKGNVVRRMFQEIDAKCYVLVDGDDTYPSNSALKMIDFVNNKMSDMVIGDRLSTTYYTENKRQFHNFGNKIVKLMINKVFKSNILDVMSGYRAFSYRFVKSFPIISRGFEIETEMTIFAIDKNFKIDSVEIEYRDRPSGSESKLSTVSDGFKVIFTIIKLFSMYRPLVFYGMISLVLALIATILFIPIINTFVLTGLVPKFPTLVVLTSFYILAIQLFTTGLILETMNLKNKQDFEFELKKIIYRFTEASNSDI